MNHDQPVHPPVLVLQAGRALTLPARPHLWLQVLQGRVWLTTPGDAADHFLHAGQRWPLGAAGVVVEPDGAGPVHCQLLAQPSVAAAQRAKPALAAAPGPTGAALSR